MPLSLFDHSRPAHFRSVHGVRGAFDHSFGGELSTVGLRFVNLDPPPHLLFRLDLADAAIPIDLPGFSYLPLVYGFHYAAYDGEFVYRMLSQNEVELVAPLSPQYDPDFPYPQHPASFPSAPVSFERVPYDPRNAEDALSLQGVFGIDGLAGPELERAIRLAFADNNYVDVLSEDPSRADLTDEEVLRWQGRAPFMQWPPLKSCTNPQCSAEVAYHVDASEIELDRETSELIGQETMKIEAHDVRVDTMRVVAIHEPDPGQEWIWGDLFTQLVFEVCSCCHCIRVSNQCT